ncbi:unnamed protein product [Linum trigynum]|uniref:GRF-type domain-containing protein n=1 Tax=Linum trigynum TaxID=586398 RepID=A0AAV2F5X0_9ROSI
MSQRGSRGARKNGGDSGSTSVKSGFSFLCEHNVPAVINTSGTELNPGRQFYGCRYWRDVDFFRWVNGNEEPLDSRNHEMESIIMNLEERLMLVESNAEKRKKEKKVADIRIKEFDASLPS